MRYEEGQEEYTRLKNAQKHLAGAEDSAPAAEASHGAGVSGDVVQSLG